MRYILRISFIFLLVISPLQAEEEKINIYSPSFNYGEVIPTKYTCEGKDISIPLQWFGRPKNAKSYVIVMYDPDAPSGKFIHWILYDIPTKIIGLRKNFPKRPLVNGIKQGLNDFGNIGYGGPCPPYGESHRYFITIYAIDKASLELSPGARPEDIFYKIRNHIVGKGEYMGVYKR